MAIVTLQEVRDQGFTNPPFSDARINSAIEEIEDYIIQMTGNWFDARTLTLSLDGNGAAVLPIPHPIISISEITINGDLVDLDEIKVYNRHLSGYLDADDRQDPKIEFAYDYYDLVQTRYAYRHWPKGAQNIGVTGKFGYRDYDPTNTEGKVPLLLKRAFYMLMPRFVENAADPRSQGAWRSHETSRKSTKNQSCQLESAVTKGNLYGGITGDLNIDRILGLYVKPIGCATV